MVLEAVALTTAGHGSGRPVQFLDATSLVYSSGHGIVAHDVESGALVSGGGVYVQTEQQISAIALL